MNLSTSHDRKNRIIIAKRPAVGIPIQVKNLCKELKDFLFKKPQNIDKKEKL